MFNFEFKSTFNTHDLSSQRVFNSEFLWEAAVNQHVVSPDLKEPLGSEHFFAHLRSRETKCCLFTFFAGSDSTGFWAGLVLVRPISLKKCFRNSNKDILFNMAAALTYDC